MRINKVYITVFFILCLILAPSVQSQDHDVDWSDPESIDIFQDDLGDFLDTDLSEYSQKAYDAYQAGEWETAAGYYLALLKYNITDGGSLYNLACCFGLMGEAELAALYLERAYAAGFTDLEHISWDPDFDSVRESDAWIESIERLTALAEEQEVDLGTVFYTKSPSFFECRLMLPDDFDPEKSYPLIVGLHGYGANPDSFITLYERFGTRDFIYASPRAPYPFSVGNRIGYSWANGDENDEDLWPQAAAMSEQYVIEVVETLKVRFNVDECYLMGFSQGCGFTYMTGIQYDHHFDGLICFGGWLDTEWLTEDEIAEANHLRVFIGHGNEDRMVEFESGTMAMETLETAGYDVTFYEFDGAHRVPEEMCQAVMDWLNE